MHTSSSMRFGDCNTTFLSINSFKCQLEIPLGDKSFRYLCQLWQLLCNHPPHSSLSKSNIYYHRIWCLDRHVAYWQWHRIQWDTVPWRFARQASPQSGLYQGRICQLLVHVVGLGIWASDLVYAVQARRFVSCYTWWGLPCIPSLSSAASISSLDTPNPRQ